MPEPGLPGALLAPLTPLLEITPAEGVTVLFVGHLSRTRLHDPAGDTRPDRPDCERAAQRRRTSVDIDEEVDAAEQQEEAPGREPGR